MLDEKEAPPSGSDVGLLKYDLGRPTSDVGHPTLDLGRPALDVGHPTRWIAKTDPLGTTDKRKYTQMEHIGCGQWTTKNKLCHTHTPLYMEQSVP